MEKRKYKRLELHVSIQLEALQDASGGNAEAEKELEVTVTDLSGGGIGFDSTAKLQKGQYYNTNMAIWTKEIIPCVVEIVREVESDGIYHYGGIFIGMNDIDKRKIYVYQLIAEMEENQR